MFEIKNLQVRDNQDFAPALEGHNNRPATYSTDIIRVSLDSELKNSRGTETYFRTDSRIRSYGFS